MTKILGHADTLAILKNSVLSKKTAHSYLFSGIDGIGKKLVAVEFACMLNCPSYEAEELHKCRVCDLIRKGSHADVRIVTPQKGSIRIDNVRQIQSFLKYSPVEAQYRVIILDDAHLINRSAQNALLKTLEEPPGSSVLILVTSRASALLPTVKSRLRHVRFGPLERPLIAEELARKRKIGPDEAMSLAGLASGSLGRAIELLSANTLKFRNTLTEFFTAGPDFGLASLLDLSFRISSDVQNFTDAIEFGMTWIRDLIVLKSGGATTSVIHTDLIDILATSAQHHPIRELLEIHTEMAKALELLNADTNINRNMLADVMFLRIRKMLDYKTGDPSRLSVIEDSSHA